MSLVWRMPNWAIFSNRSITGLRDSSSVLTVRPEFSIRSVLASAFANSSDDSNAFSEERLVGRPSI